MLHDNRVLLERRTAINGCIPRTALEPGHWECQVDSSNWVPYQWPACSIIEQGYCRWKPNVEFSERGHEYCVEFKQACTADLFVAIQINKRTQVRRAVRRFPTQNREEHIRSMKAYEESMRAETAARVKAAWANWIQAPWTWMLLDAGSCSDSSVGFLFNLSPKDGAGLAQNQDELPSSEIPAQVPYSMGSACGDPSWPPIVQGWSTQGLLCAAHPFGQRCNFSMQRLSAIEAGASDILRTEWDQLQQIWRQGGLSNKLVGAFRIQNRGLLHAFQAMRVTMLDRLAGENFKDGVSRQGQLSVQLLWHGTKAVSHLLDICSDGFDRARAQTCVYGKGCYFAKSASYSNKYACPVKVGGEPASRYRAVLLAMVLVGETIEGTSQMYPAPVKPHSRSGDRYENAVDKTSNPGIFVTFKDSQAAPVYVMIYEP